jgi:hypothetical protein
LPALLPEQPVSGFPVLILAKLAPLLKATVSRQFRWAGVVPVRKISAKLRYTR